MGTCPYGDCGFSGTEAEVEDHYLYLIRCDDPEHAADQRR
jgi:hypothetical protein